MDAAKVGMREFRHRFGSYAESDKPIAVTKHGRTIGIYIPTRGAPVAEDLKALREAGRVLDAWMASNGVGEEELVADFKEIKKAGKKRGR